MQLIINANALDKGSAAVTSQTDLTPVENIEDLVLGDDTPLDITFTGTGGVVPSWAGDATYTLSVGLGTLDANGGADYSGTTSFTIQTAGWTGTLPLTTQQLIDALALQVGSAVDWTRFPTTLRTPYPRPYGGYFALQIRVIAPNGYPVTYAMLRVFLRSRVIPQSQVTQPTLEVAVLASSINGVLISPSNFFNANGVYFNPMTTLGDMIVGVAAGAMARLAVGTNGQVVKVVGGVPAWSSDTGFNNPMTTLGDVIYGGSSGTPTRLAGNTTAAKQFFSQTGDGVNSAAPAWAALVNGDIPSALTGKTYNGLTLTSTTGTFTLAAGKVLTVSNTLTFAGTDSSTLNIGTGGMLGTAAFTAATAYAASGLATASGLTMNTAKILGRATAGVGAIEEIAVTGSGSVVLATAPGIVGGTHTAITSLGIRSTGAAFDLTLASAEVLTAGRTLTFNLGDAARTLTLSGNPTLSGFTATGTGTLALGTKTLTVSNTLTFTGTDSSSVAFGAGGTVLYSGGSYVASITGTAGQVTASAATGAVTLSLPSALTGVNSVTSVAGQALVLATGTSGTALTIASATNIATFSAAVVATGSITATGTTAGLIAIATNGNNHLAFRNASAPSTDVWVNYVGGSNTLGWYTSADKMTLTTGGNLTISGLFTSGAVGGVLMATNQNLGTGAGVGLGTLTNAPAAGNPTKWIPVNDNGTTRYFPAW